MSLVLGATRLKGEKDANKTPQSRASELCGGPQTAWLHDAPSSDFKASPLQSIKISLLQAAKLAHFIALLVIELLNLIEQLAKVGLSS